MERLIKDKWLKYDEETLLVTLGPRFLGQMRKWIPTVTNVVHCHCSLLVLRGYFCKCKQTGCHVKCLLPNHKTDPAAIRCKKCKKTIKSQKKVIQHKGSKHQIEIGNIQCFYTLGRHKVATGLSCPSLALDQKSFHNLVGESNPRPLRLLQHQVTNLTILPLSH